MHGVCATKAKVIAVREKKFYPTRYFRNIARALGISARGAKYWLRRSDKYQEIIQDIPPQHLVSTSCIYGRKWHWYGCLKDRG